MRTLDKIMESDPGLWEYWGFSLWSWGALGGVSRRVTFIKPALLGEVAKYYAEDTVIWRCGCEADRDALWKSLRPKEDLMTQRYLFLTQDSFKRRVKTFMFGIKGMAEFHSYMPGQKFIKSLKDLAPLVDRAAALHEEKSKEASNM